MSVKKVVMTLSKDVDVDSLREFFTELCTNFCCGYKSKLVKSSKMLF